MRTIRTATIATGFTEKSRTTTLYSLFGNSGPSRAKWYQNVAFMNAGESDIYVAVLDVGNALASDIDALRIQPGESRVIPKLHTQWTYVWIENETKSNILEFMAEELDEFKERYAL